MLLSLPEELQVNALLSTSKSHKSVLNIVIQNPELLAAIPDNVLIAVTKNGLKSKMFWFHVLKHLPSEKCTILFRALKDTLKNMKWIAAFMTEQSTEKRTAIYEVMKDRWPHMISFEPGNEEEFEVALKCLATDEQRTEMYNAIKDKIPAILKTDYELLDSEALKCLTQDQQAAIIGIKKLMDDLGNTAYPADITAFASALMSDDNAKIKTQVELLLKNASQRDVLVTALSNLEPVWQRKLLFIELNNEQHLEEAPNQANDINKRSLTKENLRDLQSDSANYSSINSNSAAEHKEKDMNWSFCLKFLSSIGEGSMLVVGLLIRLVMAGARLLGVGVQNENDQDDQDNMMSWGDVD